MPVVCLRASRPASIPHLLTDSHTVPLLTPLPSLQAARARALAERRAARIQERDLARRREYVRRCRLELEEKRRVEEEEAARIEEEKRTREVRLLALPVKKCLCRGSPACCSCSWCC